MCETDATRRWGSFASLLLAVIRSSSVSCHHNVGLRWPSSSSRAAGCVPSCCLVTARYGGRELLAGPGCCAAVPAQASAAQSETRVGCQLQSWAAAEHRGQQQSVSTAA